MYSKCINVQSHGILRSDVDFKTRQAFAMAGEKAADDAVGSSRSMSLCDEEKRNRAAVQARLDQIERPVRLGIGLDMSHLELLLVDLERNCEIIGAEIAGRDAKMEAELQAEL